MVNVHPDYFKECKGDLEVLDISYLPTTNQLEYQCKLPDGKVEWLKDCAIIGLGDTYTRIL